MDVWESLVTPVTVVIEVTEREEYVIKGMAASSVDEDISVIVAVTL